MSGKRQTTARRRQGGKGKPFTKGDSRANKDGRPLLTPTEVEVRDLARMKSPSCIKRLDKLGKGVGSTAVRANEILLERAWGKPKQEVAVSGVGGGPVQLEVKAVNPKDLSDEQLRQLDALLARVQPPEPGAGEG